MADRKAAIRPLGVADLLVKAVHDSAVSRGEYREKREDESWYGWACAYEHDVEGEVFTR